jgi:5-aminopentanamidase
MADRAAMFVFVEVLDGFDNANGYQISGIGTLMIKSLRLSLMHLALRPGDLGHNRGLVTHAMQVAAQRGADWVVSPELCTCGLQFPAQIGTEWIEPQPDAWMAELCQGVRALKLTAFISLPERDAHTGKYYNTVFMIDADGRIIGMHRKVNVLADSDGWSSPGERIAPIRWQNIKIGLLICADAYTSDIVASLKAQGADILVSPAAWGPGLHGPNGEWEQRTVETGLPLIVCNRTGQERTLGFVGAESLVVKNGRRLLAYHSERSVVLTFDWNLATMELMSNDCYQDYL